ncbi:hypothetical protein WDW89_16960 [Deltaproteobacteria bacterium TL4]
MSESFPGADVSFYIPSINVPFPLFRKWGVVVVVLLIVSCQKADYPLTYTSYPKDIQNQVNLICQDVAASHFVVRDHQVLLKNRKDGSIFTITHFQTKLPDNYYFCSQQAHPPSFAE